MSELAPSQSELSTRVTRVQHALTRVLDDSVDPMERLADSAFLIEHGEVARAAAALDKLDDIEEAREHREFAQRLVEGERLRREIIGPPADAKLAASKFADPKVDIQIAPHPDAKFTIVTFSGFNSGFFLPREPLRGRSYNFIALRDRNLCFHMAGVTGLAPTYASCAVQLGRIIEALGAADEWYGAGFSAGGYAALRFGLDVRARCIASFSGMPSLDLDSIPNSDLDVYPLLTRLYRRAPTEALDLVPLYQRAARQPAVILVYGEQNTRDRLFAERMAGVGGVSLAPLGGFEGHDTYRELSERGLLDDFFDRFLER